MYPSLVLVLLFINGIELHYARFVQADMGNENLALQTHVDVAFFNPARDRTTSNEIGGSVTSSHESVSSPKRVARGAKDGSKKRETVNSYRHPRPHDPDGYFTTPRNTRHISRGFSNVVLRNTSDKGTVFVQNPLYPVTENSYGAYAVMLIALILFAVGIVGNLALMCTVWHNYYLKNAWNSILASLAFCDFLVLFFCLPIVVFNELTTKRLLGDISCRMVPYMEVTSLGVATFSLCALSIDRFHASTRPRPLVEPCQSILAKLSIVWVGSMVLALPELLLWQLTQDVVPTGSLGPEAGAETDAALPGSRRSGLVVESCVRQPSPELPESVYSLVLTYHEARMWWCFGCYLCLPLLFTAACCLLTRHTVAQRSPHTATGGRVAAEHSSLPSSTTSSSSSAHRKRKRQHSAREERLSATVTALAGVYAACCLPESMCAITLAYVDLPVSAATEAALALGGQMLLFARCSATPVLLLCLCRWLGQAFMDCCCCCCCDECLADGSASSSCSASTAVATPTPPAPPPGEEKRSRAKDAVAAVAMVTSC